jgi:hypothetical protein
MRVLPKLFAAAVLAFAPSGPGAVAAAQVASSTVIHMDPGQVVLELVGQMVDAQSSGAQSSQFGFLSFIKGLDSTFFSDEPPFDRTTATFGFSTQATTTREIKNGPLLIVNREGTTNITYTPCPLCLTPALIPVFVIQSSTLRQQVVVNTETRSVSIENVNTVTTARPFNVGGKQYQLGAVGEAFNSSLTGQLDPAALTAGRFAGYAVGAAIVKPLPRAQ